MGTLFRLVNWHVGTFAVVPQVQALVMSTSIQIVETFRGTETAICFTRLEQALDMRVV